MKKKRLLVILILQLQLFCFFTSFAQKIVKPIILSPYNFHLGDEEGLPNQEIFDIYEDTKGYIWLATAKGLVKYDGKYFQLYENKDAESGKGTGIYQNTEDEIYYPNFEGDLLILKNNELKSKEINSTKGKQQNVSYVKVTSGNLYILKGFILLIRNYKLGSVKTINLKNILPEINEKSLIQIICKSETSIFITVDNKGIITVDNENAVFTKYNPKLFPKIVYSVSRCGYFKDTLWIANRFNGDLHYFTKGKYGFKKNLFEDNPSQITILGEGPKGSIWIGTLNGAFPLYPNNFGPILKGKAISKFKLDSDKNWFVGTLQEGLYVFPFSNSWVVELNNNQREINKNISILNKNESGNLLAATINGDAFLVEGNKVKHFTAPGNPEFSSIISSKETNRLYIGGIRLFIFDLSTGKLIGSQIMGSIKSLALLDKNHIVEASSAGLLLYSSLKDQGKEDHLFDSVQKRSIKLDSSQTANINDPTTKVKRGPCQYVFIDSKKNIWSSFQDGLYCSDLYNFRKIESPSNPKHIIVSEITETDDGTIYIATKNLGILVYKNGVPIHQINMLNGIEIKSVSSITSFKNSIIFSSNSGIFRIDSNNIIAYMSYRNGLCSDQILSLKTNGIDLYTATPRGLFKYPITFIEPLKNVILNITRIYANNNLTPFQKESITFSSEYKTFQFEFDGLGFYQKQPLNYQVILEGLEVEWRNVKNLNTAIYSALSFGDYCFKVRIVDAFGNTISKEKKLSFKIEKPFYKSIWFILFMVFAILGIAIGFVKYLISTAARSSQIITLGTSLKFSQLSALVAQMNPHFLFNSLNTIQHAVQINQKDKAVQLLQKFSKMMRQILEMSHKQNISILNEFQSLELFLEIEKARFEDQLHYTIEMDPNIDPETKIPTLIIQPFVENAIKHGIRHNEDGGWVHIAFKNETDNTIVVSIDDNGVGREVSQKLNQEMGRKHTSFAMGAIEKRISLLNEGKREKIELSIIDKKNEAGFPEGTLVKIRIPTYA